MSYEEFSEFPPDHLLTLDLASEISGVSVEELCRAAINGEIECIREPRRAIRVTLITALTYAPASDE